MTDLVGFDSGGLVLVGVVSFILNAVVCTLSTFHQKKKSNRLLEKSQRELSIRIHQLEEDLASSREEQRDRWAEFRKTIARLEFRGSGASEHFQRSTMFGLDKKHQVCSLARQGLAAEEISKKLNLYRGETELVLGLRKYSARTEIVDARTSLQ